MKIAEKRLCLTGNAVFRGPVRVAVAGVVVVVATDVVVVDVVGNQRLDDRLAIKALQNFGLRFSLRKKVIAKKTGGSSFALSS